MSRLSTNQVAVNGTAQPLSPTHFQVGTFLFKAHAANTGEVYWGGEGVSASNGIPLSAGEEVRVAFSTRPRDVLDLKPSEVYVLGTPGDRVGWIATHRIA